MPFFFSLRDDITEDTAQSVIEDTEERPRKQYSEQITVVSFRKRKVTKNKPNTAKQGHFL